MAFNDIEVANIKRCMDFFMEKRRPHKFIRDEVDLIYEMQDQSVIIKEVRNIMGRIVESHIAMISFIPSQNGWKLFRLNGWGEWEDTHDGFIATFSIAIKIVDDDSVGYFFG